MTMKIVVGSDPKPTTEQLLEMFEKLDAQVKEIKGQMRRGALNSRHIQALIEHRNSFQYKDWTNAPLRHDKTSEGYTLLENTPFDGRGFVPEILTAVVPGVLSVDGDTMRNRAMRLGACLGQHYAEYLMDHQDLLSKSLREECRLVFPGTVWQDAAGDLFIPSLHWNWRGATWDLSLVRLNRDWQSKDCLIRAT